MAPMLTHMTHHPDAGPLRNSMSITHTKGLLNGPGQNNCFLNSAVQVLWHLDIFRRSFRELSGHACMRDSCIFCALKELFAQFQYSHDTALPPDALRRALAETFFIQQRFQLGFMDDAAECFENILMRIHFHIANAESEDMCNATHCIPHQKFAMTLVEQGVCRSCGATSEPLPFTQMVHYISSSALCAQSKINRDEGGDGICGDQFGQLLRKAGGMGEIRDCPSACGAKIQIHRTLMNHPDIVSIGIVWDSERPTLDHIMDVFRTIGTTIRLQDVFHSVVDDHWASSATHQLVGVVTYYGKHYSTFFFHTKLRVWIYFDDATVREIGPHWEQVVEKCRRGHFQPLLLLYANPFGTPVSTESSPKTVSYVSGHRHDECQGACYNPYNGFGLTGNVQRRAVTPSPEVHLDHMSDIRPRRAITPNAELHHREAQLNDVNAGLYHQGHQDQVDSDMGYSSADRGGPKMPIVNRMPHNGYANYGTHPQSYANGLQKTRQPDPAIPLRANGYFNNCDVPDSSYMAKNPTISNATVYQQGSVSQAAPENIYISRKTVENVLNYQKVQRHRYMGGNYNGTTAGNRNSNSSLESFENAIRMRGQMSGAYPYEGKPEPQEAAPLTASNVPRCRDSGNWSGDRNSASSTSSASMENPYYIVVGNKRSASIGAQGYRNSPSKVPPETMGRAPYDAGYDSFSLSSNDSFPINQHLHPKHMQQLAQIPENVLDPQARAAQTQDECQTLCIEADKFLEKSVEKENTGDIDGAISLCNGAAAKARAAMDAPYSNPQILAFARMKHNVCVMRARSLHRRMLVRQDSINSHGSSSTSTEPDSPRKLDADVGGAIHHSRQSSRDSTRSRSGNHSRQSSRDGGHVRQNSRDASNHSRQSSQDAAEKKRIELYGTLPKKSSKKKPEKLRTGSIRIKDERALHGPAAPSLADRPQQMLPAQFPQPIASDCPDYGEWEGTRRPNLHRTNSIPPNFHQDLGNTQSITDLSKDDAAKANAAKLGKKQHKIRRKLMGGLIRRKNRSMPDLREGQDPVAFEDYSLRKSEQSLDVQQGHHGNAASQRLYSSHGKIPPPPPVRTTSQLTARSQSHGNLLLPPPSPDFPPPPPELLQAYFPPPPDQLYPTNQVTVQADVHHERTPSDNIRPVCLVRRPSISSARPVAPPSQRSPGGDHPEAEACPAGGLLAELRLKRQQILESGTAKASQEPKAPTSSGSNWLRELQAKQQQMLVKKHDGTSGCKTNNEAALTNDGPAIIPQHRFAPSMLPHEQLPQVAKPLPAYREVATSVAQLPAPEIVTALHPSVTKMEAKDPSAGAAGDYKPKSVRDLASRFEQILLTPPASNSPPQPVGTLDRQPDTKKEINHDRGATNVASPHLHYLQPPGIDCIDGSSKNGYGAPAAQGELQNPAYPVHSLNRVYECRPKYNPAPYGTQFATANRSCHPPNDWPYRTEQAHSSSHQLISANQYITGVNQHGTIGNQQVASVNQQIIGVNQNVNSVARSDILHYGDAKAPNGWSQNCYSSSNPGDSATFRRAMEEHSDITNGAFRRLHDERNDASNGAFRRTQEERCDAADGIFRRTLEEYNDTINQPDTCNLAAQNVVRQAPNGISGAPEPAKCQRILPNYNPPPPVGPRAVPNGVPATGAPPRQATYDQQAMQRMQQQQQRRTPTSAVEQLDRAATMGRKKKGKKSVTFSDQIVLVACADDDLMALPNPLLEKVLHKSSLASGTQPKVAFNPLYEPPHDEPFKAPSDPRLQHYLCQPTGGGYNGSYGLPPPNAGPTPNGAKKAAGAKVPCYLCGKKTVTPPVTYCSDCDFYMSRFKPKK